MNNTLLNISGKIDQESLAIYAAVKNAATELDIPFLVVGASARDLVLHYAYGARIKRATADIDFGIQISDWNSFNLLRDALIKAGFTETRSTHRLISPHNKIVDIVPFGSIEDENANITWPPEGKVTMNVLGFTEALENSVQVRLQDKPEMDIPVAMPPGLSLLKIVAWMDRDTDLRSKDAKDLLFLLKSYEEIPDVVEEIYEYPDIMEQYDWDITSSSAFLLGKHTKDIATQATANKLSDIFNQPEILVEEMCEDIEQEFERNNALLTAYINGLNYKN